jgi:hypothetical protein
MTKTAQELALALKGILDSGDEMHADNQLTILDASIFLANIAMEPPHPSLPKREKIVGEMAQAIWKRLDPNDEIAGMGIMPNRFYEAANLAYTIISPYLARGKE